MAVLDVVTSIMTYVLSFKSFDNSVQTTELHGAAPVSVLNKRSVNARTHTNLHATDDGRGAQLVAINRCSHIYLAVWSMSFCSTAQHSTQHSQKRMTDEK